MWPVPRGSTAAAGRVGRAHCGVSSMLLAGGPARTTVHPCSMPMACPEEGAQLSTLLQEALA